ncbi:MAG: starch-binding protein [Bacteroidaceae bacterium]|nr:starch-binding protein [Bacteroidaceae bacterium]
MKKNILWILALVLPFMGIFSSCSSDEDIIFDHERQQFETRADRILLEFIVPFGTTADEEIYITGPFNGDSTAIGNAAYLLTKAPKSDMKWGIYLDPSTFINGKTLADGFRFYSASQGKEYTTKGEQAWHTDNPGVGTFTNIWGQRWESYYWSGDEPEIEHDGFVVYVDNQTGWDAITLYMWGDKNNLNGDWPGMAPTGSVKLNGTTWTYFDMGADNSGLAENLIFNNAGGGTQLPDFAFTIDRDIYLLVTASGVEEIDPYNFKPGGDIPEPEPQGEKHKFYVKDLTGWNSVGLYAWGDDLPELFGEWPGKQDYTTETVGGVEFKVFEYTGKGDTYYPIFNGDGGQVDGPAITTDRDYYFEVTATSFVEIDKPSSGSHKIYINNQTGWDALGLYAWGEGLPELFGEWPGLTTYTSETIDGVTYQVFTYEGSGQEYHLILNNAGAGSQVDGPAITTGSDYFFTVTASEWTAKSVKARR